ncbi:MAG TPA: hypothetical protein VMZ28_03115 [Kofleriaceae bacterium]|nr:hypothetical protein [Kofleriaceae bacterium]
MSRPVLELAVGGERIRLSGPPVLLDTVVARYGAFVGAAGRHAPIALEVSLGERFQPTHEREAGVRLIDAGGGVVCLDGAARGTFDLAERRGAVHGVTGLGPVDALLRAALSLTLPFDGALLVHGATVPWHGRALVLCGASGAGKSTAGLALGAACDELTVLRPGPCGVTVEATPYWQGRPLAAPLAALVCLERAREGGPAFSALRGADAVRALASHVVRYMALPAVERAVLAEVARVCTNGSVSRATCPEGPAFLPFLTARLQTATATATERAA